MRVSVSKSKNATNLFIIESFTTEDGRRSTRVVEKLGNVDDLAKKLDGVDPYEWARQRAKFLTEEANKGIQNISVSFSNRTHISSNVRHVFNGGHLFLKSIFHDLGINKFLNGVSKESDFNYDLSGIFETLLYSRIINPSSKRSDSLLSDSFLGLKSQSLHNVYRSLEVLSKVSEDLQQYVYESSRKICDRNSKILYYDLTNYFFEIENEDGFKKYGYSKEHKPNPIVQMGLFMDGNGIPLAFNLSNGNENEQVTLKPLEFRIIKDFNLSNFIVCTDCGLSSYSNRKFNSFSKRGFITTQSVKKLKGFLKEWALDPKGFRVLSSDKVYDVSCIDEDEHYDTIFYKERWINEGGLEQRLIVTYSVKYKNYLSSLRNNHIERAKKDIEGGKSSIEKKKATDYKRFIEGEYYTSDGEFATKSSYHLNEDKIISESVYDGYYAVCTNVEGNINAIISANKRRWEIEECFRILKSEFKARPVYLQREDRIKAHFLVCFVALLFYRILEQKLNSKYTCSEIISTLRDFKFSKVKSYGYSPLYTRNDITDDLHSLFGFRTDYEIVTTEDLKRILNLIKKKNITQNP